MDLVITNISEDKQEMPQWRNTTFSRHEKKERWGTINDKTNAKYEINDAQAKKRCNIKTNKT